MAAPAPWPAIPDRPQAAARHVAPIRPFPCGAIPAWKTGRRVPSAPARLPLYLASGAAGMINGENLVVDGGYAAT